ncbi:sigma-54-dependent Fis family transcriptional regulator, partial [Desulfoprunum benzoelyticum]|uniref:sigma 54-interacting transcriptional regulator n=1 Tax=Desulfoprunum benzoelyticum TaxID=1506996 RepID=UPI00196258C2
AKKGLLEMAEGGTLFLDEVGELAPSTQVKLLRYVQERCFIPLGGTEELRSDVRIIAATNRNVEQSVADGDFREDLYYRLSGVKVHLPPLRERGEDALALAEHFLEKACRAQKRQLRGFTAEARRKLLAYGYPGNVRELRNCMERAVLICNEEAIRTYHLPPTLQTAESSATDNQLSFGEAVGKFEQEILVEALQKCGGNMLQVARELRASYRIINYKIKKYNLDPKKYD